MSELKALDLCSGVGAGFPLAAEKLGGFDLVGLCEWDSYCQSILKLRFPGVKIAENIWDLCWDYSSAPPPLIRDWRGGKLDLLSASPPCQPFSVQGNREGSEDWRDCFPAVLEIVRILEPRFICIENVKGLLNCPHKPGQKFLYFQWLLLRLHECGYDLEWLTVSSGHFGTPWKRERLLLVGVSRSLKLDWKRTTPWTLAVRKSVEEAKPLKQRGGMQSELDRTELWDSFAMDEPIGVKSRNSTIRNRRQALGNCLDPRVAAIALRRVLYLNSLTQIQKEAQSQQEAS